MKIVYNFLFLLCLVLDSSLLGQDQESTPSIKELLHTYNLANKSSFPFQSNMTYECVSQYRLIGDNKTHQQLSQQEKEKSYFQLSFSEDFTVLTSSDAKVYKESISTAKGRLYANKVIINSKVLYYKIRTTDNKGIYKSVFVPGYGNLIHDFAQCQLKEM